MRQRSSGYKYTLEQLNQTEMLQMRICRFQVKPVPIYYYFNRTPLLSQHKRAAHHLEEHPNQLQGKMHLWPFCEAEQPFNRWAKHYLKVNNPRANTNIYNRITMKKFPVWHNTHLKRSTCIVDPWNCRGKWNTRGTWALWVTWNVVSDGQEQSTAEEHSQGKRSRTGHYPAEWALTTIRNISIAGSRKTKSQSLLNLLLLPIS